MDQINIGRYLGIDLGTTNTAMATVYFTTDNKVDIKVEKFKSRKSRQGNEYLPSAIYLKDDGEYLYGFEAKDHINQLQSEFGDIKPYVINAKKLMGTDEIFNLGAHKLKAIDVAKKILKKCGDEFNKIYANFPKIRYDLVPTVITVPARFENPAKEDTINAAINVGYKEGIRLLEEPTAALLSYLYHQMQNEEDIRAVHISKPKTFMVVDLGGGTCDIVIIDVTEKNESGKKKLCFSNFKNPNRVDLGGADFDSKFSTYLLKKFFELNSIRYDSIPHDIKNSLKTKLFLVAEEKKEQFSISIEQRTNSIEDVVYNRVNIQELYSAVPDEEINIRNFYNNIDFNYKVTLKEYLECINTLLVKRETHALTIEEDIKNKNFEDAILKTLEINNVKLDNIDYVLFTGGMSLFLPLKKKLYEITNKRIVWPHNPMTAVAEGAALFSLFKNAEKNDQYLNEKDVFHVDENSTIYKYIPNLEINGTLPCAYLIDKKDQLPVVLVDKNTPYPQPKRYVEKKFTTNSPIGVIINIYSGQDKYDPNLRRLKPLKCFFNLNNEKMLGTNFDIWYELSENGTIKIGVKFPDTGEEFEWR